MTTMTEVEWTSDLIIRLVQEYSKKPELWDSTHELYRMQTAKYEAWCELAALFECDISDLRKKLNSIFASHRREKAKVRFGGKTTWFLYPYMKFLPNHLENDPSADAKILKRNTQHYLQEEEEQSSHDDDNEDNDAQDEIPTLVVVKEEPKPQKIIAAPRTFHKPRLTRPLKRKLVKDPNTLDSRLVEALKLLRRADLGRKKDECDSFGEYIADSLRKHDERTQAMIKQAINNILFEQEMKKYSAGPYGGMVVCVDENPLILGDDPHEK